MSDFIALWLDSIKFKVEPNTFDGYKLYCDNHIVPYFKSHPIKLSAVTFDEVQSFLNEKLKKGRLDGKGGLSVKTVREFKNILSSVFKYARKKHLINENPCDLVELPKRTKKEPTFYTKEQALNLLTLIKDEKLYPLIYFTLIYGLRRSELLGLKWDSVDFPNRILTIKHTVVDYADRYEKDTTKTDSSMRSYPMTDEVYSLLMEAKNSEDLNRKIFGKTYQYNDYVFKWEDGHPFDPDYVSAKFQKLLKKYALPHIRFHDLRHTCASILVNDGMELKDISAWLGHSSIQITADYYGHLNMDRKNVIAKVMSQSISTKNTAS